MSNDEAPRGPIELQAIVVQCGVCGDPLKHSGLKWEHTIQPPPQFHHKPEPKPVGTEPVIPPE